MATRWEFILSQIFFCLENFTTISLFWHFTAILSFAKRLHPQLKLHHRGLPDPPGHHVPHLLLYPGGLFLLPGEYKLYYNFRGEAHGPFLFQELTACLLKQLLGSA